MRRSIFAVAALSLWLVGGAWGQNPPGQGMLVPSPAPGCPLTGCTYSTSGGATTLAINPASVAQLGTFLTSIGGAFDVSGYDYSAATAISRFIMLQTTLAPSVDTTNIWEGNSSFLALKGPGRAQGEINLHHTYFQADVGATSTSQVEGYESSVLNNGTLGSFFGNLNIFNNVAGTVTGGIYGAKYQLTNSNATGGAIFVYAAIDLEPMAGGGSVPTFYYLIRNNEPNAYLSTLGNINIGTLSPTNTKLYVQGPDASAGTFPVAFKNSTSNNLFLVGDDGAVLVPTGGLVLGAAAGGQKGAGTINATGFFANGTTGLASKTCTINAANVTTGITLTITQGIITATTTC